MLLCVFVAAWWVSCWLSLLLGGCRAGCVTAVVSVAAWWVSSLLLGGCGAAGCGAAGVAVLLLCVSAAGVVPAAVPAWCYGG